MPKKNLLVIIVTFLIIICILWFFKSKPIISEIGTELSQEEIEKDIVLLTEDDLRKIIRITIVDNGQYERYTVKENGIVDESMRLIQIVAKSKNSNYPEGLEYKIAVKVLNHLNQRKTPYKIAGVLSDISRSYVMDYNRVAFVTNKDFLEQLNSNKDSTDEEQLIELISKNLMDKK
jgi:hypothetical protein